MTGTKKSLGREALKLIPRRHHPCAVSLPRDFRCCFGRLRIDGPAQHGGWPFRQSPGALSRVAMAEASRFWRTKARF